ncbi:enoyl-CoA hydratase/isomerase family protein [Jiella sp. MQZ9-1]|uniref:3-hydroxyisobutyryl-CoA hydrolase n=1 Tax=Jiella flava TaxID=2816857 RepID=A0A939G234_9HYPH|nr:enoyl-CoA hydratase/isomerase family protein [Jiella flava]MBO0664316.1 enoyl-CoA hydratase/isomerase family protein [Jiella flava]MCD2472761.1 enoyl-CoA hydratase/isomerase family protein [Jiella flava]
MGEIGGKVVGVELRRVGRAGRITLNKPKALNALDRDMALAIEGALTGWMDDETVDVIVIDAAGDKAFCAGGDIAALYHEGKAGRFDPARRFFADEYRLNRMIARYPKPYVAFIDGIVMGGGVGLSAHGDLAIVTERSMVAMPECAIGLIPDVGGTLVLAQAPGRLGEFLGLTGFRMTAADAIFAGFADRYMPVAKIEGAIARLEKTGDPAVLEDLFEAPPAGELSGLQADVDRFFAADDAAAILAALEADDSPFAARTAGVIRRGSPLSVAVTLDLIRAARADPVIETSLAREYRYTYRSQSDGDFLEGTRAAVIDKDKTPHWPIARIEDLPPQRVAAMLAPLGEDDLTF